ncbi:MAG: hypothetical protein OXC07_02000 [Kistimonas sp.]|nr:hypothetical protein [Kistimonas sp.]
MTVARDEVTGFALLTRQSRWMERVSACQGEISRCFAEKVPDRLESALAYPVASFELSSVRCASAGKAWALANGVVFRTLIAGAPDRGRDAWQDACSYTVLEPEAPARIASGYFGFYGQADDIRAGPMSRMERGLMEDFVGVLMRLWGEVWGHAVAFDDQPPVWLQSVPTAVSALVCSCFFYEICRYTGTLMMTMPVACVESALRAADRDKADRDKDRDKLARSETEHDTGGTQRQRNSRLAACVMRAPVRVRGELSHRMIALERLDQLTPGDLIGIPWPASACLCVGPLRFCTARVVQKSGRLALEVVSRCET